MILFVANDQNGERTGSDGLNGGNVRRWEACELSTAVNHQPSAGSEEGFAEPGILAKTRVVICRFLQIGEGSLRDQGFDTRIGAGGLQGDSRAHGFAESEEMLRLFRSLQRVDNSAGVLALKPAVSGDFSAAFAVAPRVHHDDVVTILQEKFRLTDHADAIVGNTVKEHDPRAIWIFRAHFPAAENGAIRSANCEIFATAVRVFEAFVGFADQVRRKRALHGMEKHRPGKPAADRG